MTIIAFLVLLVAVVIAFLNMQFLPLNLYFMTVSAPLWLIIAISLLVGMLASALFAGAKSTSSRKSLQTKEHELQDKLDRKDAELEAAKQETNEVAERTRNEMERDLKMKQKDEEIKSLQRHLDLMEKKIQLQKDRIHTNQDEEVVLIPDRNPTASDDTIVSNDDVLPDQSGFHPSDKQKVDPSNRV